MEKIKIVAILECSTGNDSVGEMWKETKVFDIDESLFEVFEWARKGYQIENFRGNLTLTIAQ